jgi:hypothetical protein
MRLAVELGGRRHGQAAFLALHELRNPVEVWAKLGGRRRCLWASFSFLLASLWSFDPDQHEWFQIPGENLSSIHGG